MRILHVIESFAPGGIETTFLTCCVSLRDQDASVEHHVLAFAGGALEQRYRDGALGHDWRATTAPSIGSSTANYDVAHMLFERCASRIVPEILARTPMPVVYGKGYDLGGMYRLNEGLRWQADESLLAACDGVTFTTANLAAGYDLPPDARRFSARPPTSRDFRRSRSQTMSTPLRIVCVANLHPRKRLGDLVDGARPRKARAFPTLNCVWSAAAAPADAERLRSLAARVGVGDSVTLAGLVSDVVPEIRLGASRRAALVLRGCADRAARRHGGGPSGRRDRRRPRPQHRGRGQSKDFSFRSATSTRWRTG